MLATKQFNVTFFTLFRIKVYRIKGETKTVSLMFNQKLVHEQNAHSTFSFNRGRKHTKNTKFNWCGI